MRDSQVRHGTRQLACQVIRCVNQFGSKEVRLRRSRPHDMGDRLTIDGDWLRRDAVRRQDL